MTCNCDNNGSNEYIIELNQQGAPGVRGEKGEQGYSPTVSYISDGSGLVINIVNEQDTISTPVIPLKSYVDTLLDTKMNTDGSNAASSVKFNNITFSYTGATRQDIKAINYQELLIAGQGLYLQGHASQAQAYPNSISIAPRGTSISIGNANRHSVVVDNDGAFYDGNEIATVDQIPSITGKLNTSGSNASNDFTVNGVELAGNYVYMNSVSYGGVSVTQSNSDIYAKLEVDSSKGYLKLPGLNINSGASGNIACNTIRDIVLNGSNTSYKMYYHGTSASNEIATLADIPSVTSFLDKSGSNADINFTVNGIKLSANTISSSVSTGSTRLTLSQTTSGNYIDIGAGSTGTYFYTNGFSFSSSTSNQIPDIVMSSTGDIKIYPTLGAKLYYGSSKTVANEVATKGNLPSNFTGCDSITAGTAGLVPAPSAGDEDKFLKADGTWDTIGGGGSITVDQTYDGTSANPQSGVAIQGELTTNYQGKLTAGSNIQIDGTTISATNTTYSTMSVSEGVTGTATNSRTVRADYLKQIIQGTKLTGLSTATNSAVTATDNILTGIGKLQAEINGIDISGLIARIQALENGIDGGNA